MARNLRPAVAAAVDEHLPAIGRAYRKTRSQLRARMPVRPVEFASMPAAQAIDLAYQVILRRHADPPGLENYLNFVRQGWTYTDVAAALAGSGEFHRRVRFSPIMFGPSIHTSRCQFVRSLPQGKVIVDLGGTDLGNPEGALVSMGYPYEFESLTIVDLPSEDRHALYQQQAVRDRVESELGPVFYRYHSMTDLSGFADSSVDLVYSGQSIEHVLPEDGRKVLEEVTRILRPGGHIGLDTPNARVTRLQQPQFVDPDHKVEYRLEELTAMIEGAGLEVVDVKGTNFAGKSLAQGRFDIEETARNSGLFWDADSCYILCVIARKPAT